MKRTVTLTLTLPEGWYPHDMFNRVYGASAWAYKVGEPIGAILLYDDENESGRPSPPVADLAWMACLNEEPLPSRFYKVRIVDLYAACVRLVGEDGAEIPDLALLDRALQLVCFGKQKYA